MQPSPKETSGNTTARPPRGQKQSQANKDGAEKSMTHAPRGGNSRQQQHIVALQPNAMLRRTLILSCATFGRAFNAGGRSTVRGGARSAVSMSTLADFKATKEGKDTEFAEAEAACDKTKTDLYLQCFDSISAAFLSFSIWTCRADFFFSSFSTSFEGSIKPRRFKCADTLSEKIGRAHV